MAAGSSTVSFTGLSSASAPSFSFAMAASSRVVGFENEIVGDQHPDRKAGADGDCRLDVERALHDLPARLADTVGGSLPQGLHQRIFIVAGARLRPDAEDGRQDRGFEQHAPVIVDLILQAGIALRVGTRLTLQHDRAAVWHDQAIPDEERARLAEGDLGVVSYTHLTLPT